jgi:CRISPR system Cascade subunit CasD
MQAWGERARWSVRDTAPEPTKSGVVGLLACALGLSEDDAIGQLSRQIDVGVRCDKPGIRMVDYHTVSGGVMSAEGKLKRNATTHEPETVVSWRAYLCDASFLVAVQSSDEVIARLAEAVQAPYWPIFLGRKSCPPSRPVFAGLGQYATMRMALQTESAGKTRRVRAVITCDPQEGARRRDEVDSRSRRTFLPRYTVDIRVDMPIENEED